MQNQSAAGALLRLSRATASVRAEERFGKRQAKGQSKYHGRPKSRQRGRSESNVCHRCHLATSKAQPETIIIGARRNRSFRAAVGALTSLVAHGRTPPGSKKTKLNAPRTQSSRRCVCLFQRSELPGLTWVGGGGRTLGRALDPGSGALVLTIGARRGVGPESSPGLSRALIRR